MFSGYKTYILGGLAIIGLAAKVLVGDATITDALQQGIPVLMGMTIRAGIAKS